jgi:hypothetical protein
MIYEMVAPFPTLVITKIETGKHIKVYLDTPVGKKMLTVSVSARCPKMMMNNRSILRGWTRT